jgi:zinc transport system ATP-binding protein
MSVIATFKRAEIGYHGHPVIHDVSLDVKEGEFLLVVGPNGSGKSALMKTLLGIIPAIGGVVKLFGQRTEYFSDWGNVGYLPQSLQNFSPLFPATVEEIVSMGLMVGRRFPKRKLPGDGKLTNEALDRLGIIDIRKESIGSLSGGQLQRTLLARTIVHSPSLLILDEPNVGLDPKTRDQFHKYLEGINKKNVAIIYITHDVSEIHDCASNLLYVDQRVLFHGSLKEFCKSKDMAEEFGTHAQHHMCHQHCKDL